METSNCIYPGNQSSEGQYLTLHPGCPMHNIFGGLKVMGIRHQRNLQGLCKILKGRKKHIDIYLKSDKKRFKPIFKFNPWGRMAQASDEKKAKVATRLMSLREHYDKAIKGIAKVLHKETIGIGEVLCKDTKRLLPPDCCRTDNQGDWSMDDTKKATTPDPVTKAQQASRPIRIIKIPRRYLD